MLNLLFRSVIRKKIVLLFVYNPKEEFYLTEIALKVKTTPGTARRELGRLQAADLLSFRKKGNLALYRLNSRYAFLREIQAIVKKSIGLEVELRTALTPIKGISVAFLYGSFARGDWKSDSDIDLFIIGRPPEDEVYRNLKKIEDAVGREINYSISSEEEFRDRLKTKAFLKEIVSHPLMIIGDDNDLKRLA